MITSSLIVIALASLAVAQDTLTEHVAFSSYDNYLYRDNTTASQLLFTQSNATSTRPRFIAAFPAGNSGAMVYFKAASGNSSSLTISLVDGSLKSVSNPYNQTGISGQWQLSQNAELDLAVLGSVRALRDYVEGGGLLHSDMNYTVQQLDTNSVTLYREFFDDSIAMNFTMSTGSAIQHNGTHNISFPAGTYDFTVTLNETSLQGIPPQTLINQSNQTIITNSSTADSVKSVSFLSYSEKMLAGGWRFLTYFGRDTLISLRILMPILSSDAVEAALGAVIERTNATDGELCHEETIGDYASWINMQNNQSELGSQPFYDYKMIDTNFELLPALAHYFLDLPSGSGRTTSFLAKKAVLANNMTYQQLLQKNVELVMTQSAAFAHEPSAKNLIHLKDGVPVGNWRDSNQGIGYGTIPFDVNTALVPGCLRAIQRLAKAHILHPSLSNDASKYAAVWESHALPLFQVPLNSSYAQTALSEYTTYANLSSSIYSTNGSATPPTEIYALSLMDDDKPVEIMNSDLSFNLMYNDNVSTDLMEYTVNALRPFPEGLLTNVGMLIANPAYDSNRTNWEVFTRAAYHGTCVWGFQQSMVVAGLARQLDLCNNTSSLATKQAPSWCSNSTLIANLKTAQCNLWDVILGNPDVEFAETWTWTFDNSTQSFVVTSPAELTPDSTEADAIQLWSFTLLALDKPAYCT
ncbi:hypothetical protein K450DRAFT_267434 [Umbelopsis ramanniana AG]|uniref:Uncharacterized protein n=1 Tax=Umbelopsis ramanniana AG TaxID=1314678 RepID=A0AAD5HHK6_UMBRA|nr:uncharacterized protein K450DRAFT_267434 [Umbelopsis ramanniana AG]KAI8584777.1 hypothetical protein K450DRAFT_267434 [Umbelopsis ramanniana AG]